MNTTTRLNWFWVLMVVPISLTAQEIEQVAFTGNSAISVSSNYVWRGLKLSPEIVTQPTVGISYQGFNANFWSNYDFKFNETTETDVTVSYGSAVGQVVFDIGYINYAFDGFRDTQEFYGAVGLDVILSPALTFYYDFDEGKGAFLVASMGHSVGLLKTVSLDVGVSASVNFHNVIMGVDANGLKFTGPYNAEISVSSTVPIFNAISIVPYVAYSFPISNDAKTAIQSISFDGDSNIFYGGLTVSLDL